MTADPSTRECEEAGPLLGTIIPVACMVQEADLYGLRVAVGCGGVDVFRVSLCALPLADNTAAFIVLNSCGGPSQIDLKSALSQAFKEASGLPQARMRFLQFLYDQRGLDGAFVGLWEARLGTLAYFAIGLEPPLAINFGRAHRLQDARRELQKMTFGVHRLSPGERWLLCTSSLVDAAGPQRHRFDLADLVERDHDGRGTVDELRLDNLWRRALRTHNGSLPEGSLLISLLCEKSAGQEPRSTGNAGLVADLSLAITGQRSHSKDPTTKAGLVSQDQPGRRVC